MSSSVQYSAVIDPLVLRSGNKLIVVGETGSPGQIEVEKKVRLLQVTALCLVHGLTQQDCVTRIFKCWHEVSR